MVHRVRFVSMRAHERTEFASKKKTRSCVEDFIWEKFT